MTTTLLRDLDPRAVALSACEALLAHLGRVTFVLNPHAVPLPQAADLVDGSDLGLTVQTLTTFAQHGTPVGDWATPEEGADALLTVVSALYRPALGGEGEVPGILSEGEPASDLDQVLLGAWTRVQIGRGEPVEARQIACLASCPVRTVRHHIDSGELEATDSRPARVAADRARAYLSARGVRV
jgi:hypothetical protein